MKSRRRDAGRLVLENLCVIIETGDLNQEDVHVVHSAETDLVKLCSGERAARSIWSLGICLAILMSLKRKGCGTRLLNR